MTEPILRKTPPRSAVLLWLCVTAVRAERPRLIIKPATAPITVDGELSDPGWQGAVGFDQFVYVGTDVADYRKARGRLAYDEKNLYVAVECAQDNKGLTFGKPEQEEAHFRGPHVKIWIDTGPAKGGAYCRAIYLAMNALGARYDALLRGEAGTFDGKWVCKGT